MNEIDNVKLIPPRIKVELIIYSEERMDEQLINKIVGKSATSFTQTGSKSLGGVIQNESSWTLETDYIETFEVDALIREIFSGMNNPEKVGNELAALKLNTKVCVVVEDLCVDFPSLALDKEIIRILYQLNAWIDFDVYL